MIKSQSISHVKFPFRKNYLSIYLFPVLLRIRCITIDYEKMADPNALIYTCMIGTLFIDFALESGVCLELRARDKA